MDAAGLSCAPDSDSVSEPWPSPGHVLMPLTVPLCLPGWHLSVSESSKLSCPWRFCCCTYFSSLCPPSFHVLPRACRRLFYLCLVPELCAGPHIHTACLLLKLVRSWVPLPLPSRGALLWAWLYYFSANKATFTVCCYSVTKPCPTLCDPVDCSTPRLPCPSLSPGICSVMLSNHLILCHPLLHFSFCFFLPQLLGFKTSILFLKLDPCFPTFKGVTCPTGSIFLSAPSSMVSLLSAYGSGLSWHGVWRWLKPLCFFWFPWALPQHLSTCETAGHGPVILDDGKS